MEQFNKFISAIGAGTPAWLPLIFLPVVLVITAVCMTLFGGRKFYLWIVIVLGGIGFFFVACIGELKTAFLFLGLYAVLAAALRMLFFIPCPREYFKREHRRSSREEKIYRKFHEEISVRPEPAASEEAQPKVCAFEEEQRFATAEESGMRLSHVNGLIAQLKKEELIAADRLEVDVLSRTVEAMSGRALTEEELASLNDCLASVLKLTAKYKL